MTRSPPRLLAPALMSVLALGACLPLGGCVVSTVAGAAVGVAATTVKTGVKVAGTTAGVAADGVGAVGHAVTGGH